MVDNLTAIIPFFNGHATIGDLLATLPADLPVLVVDDQSDQPLRLNNVQVARIPKKGFFSGAVNYGLELTSTDVLVLNQDLAFTSDEWLPKLLELRERYAVIGDGVMGHPAWPKGYVQGTFMFMRRDAIDQIGMLDEELYPLWGSTCEWQLRACRRGYKAHVSHEWRKWFEHEGRGEQRTRKFGSAIETALKRWPNQRRKFLRTPPEITVVMPCYNYGHYIEDAVNSLIGGPTCLGEMPGQTFNSFEVLIVDDASTDDSWDAIRAVVDPWKAVRAIRLPENMGTPGALNTGVSKARGEYIHVLSADDMREPWCLEAYYRALQQHPHSVVYGDLRVFKNGKRDRVLKLPNYSFERVLHKNPMPAGIMYPRQAWRDAGGYPSQMVYGREDWAFNIALGLAGWCGVHIGMTGNLYRRDGQNRSLRTGNKHKGEPLEGASWGARFKQQLREIFPRAYTGEWPVACCGNRSPSVSRSNPRASRPSAMVAAASVENELVLLEYIGGNYGQHAWWVGRRRYLFSASKSRQYVPAADAEKLLLERHNTKPVFRKVTLKEASPKRKSPPPRVAEPDLPSPPPESEFEAGPAVVIDATDKAHELAAEYEIDLATVAGTGAHGRITAKDVRDAIASMA